MTLGLAIGLASVAAGASDPPALPAEPTSGPRRIAVVVGVDAYHDPRIEPLRFAGADARALGQRLTAEGYELWPLVGTVTSRSVWQTLARATATAQPEDLVVVYFAGHARSVVAGGAGGGPGTELRLLFSDSSVDDLGAGIGLTALDAALSDLSTTRRVVVVDAVVPEVAGPVARREAPSGSIALSLPPGERAEAWILAPAHRRADREDPVLRQGIFARYLLEALGGAADLDGDGQVVVMEAFSHAGQRTAEHTAYAQVPRISAGVETWSALPLVGTRAEPAHAVLLWSDPGWRRWELRLDGELRGPGSVEPGVHHWELVDAAGRVDRGSVSAVPGDLLSLEAIQQGARRPVGPPPGRSVSGSSPLESSPLGSLPAASVWSGSSSVRRAPWQHAAALGFRLGFPDDPDDLEAVPALSLRSLSVPVRVRQDGSPAVGTSLEIGVMDHTLLLAHASWIGGPLQSSKRRLAVDLGLGPSVDALRNVHPVVAPAIQLLRHLDGRGIGWWEAGARAHLRDGEADLQVILSWSLGLSLSPRTLW